MVEIWENNVCETIIAHTKENISVQGDNCVLTYRRFAKYHALRALTICSRTCIFLVQYDLSKPKFQTVIK